MESLEASLSAAQQSARRDREATEKIESFSTAEMQAYRNKFHHLRRKATEQQAKLVSEKRVLLDQLDEYKGSAREVGKQIAERFKAQFDAARKAWAEEEELLKNQIFQLEQNLSRERERSETRVRQHAQEQEAQKQTRDNEERLEKARLISLSESKETTRGSIARLERRCRELERQAAAEKMELEAELSRLQQSSKLREDELRREIYRNKSDHIAELRRVQIGHAVDNVDNGDSLAQSLAASNPSQVLERESATLREENTMLVQQLERMKKEISERDQQQASELRKLKSLVVKSRLLPKSNHSNDVVDSKTS